MAVLETSFPGYTPAVLPHHEELAGTDDWTAADWEDEFGRSRLRLISFLECRDPYITLSRSAVRLLTEPTLPRAEFRRLEQVEVEMIQTLLLASPARVRAVPTSPGNFVRFWPLMSRHVEAFIRQQDASDRSVSAAISRRARRQTLYYRNLFSRDDCERVMKGILSRFDRQSHEALGYRLSDLYRAMTRIVDLIVDRLSVHRGHLVNLLHANDRSKVGAAIEFFLACSPLASRAWRGSTNKFTDLESLRNAGFQMSELTYPWVFTIPRELLKAEFDQAIVEAIYTLSYRKGDLAHVNPLHVYLNNPIWQKPYIALETGDLFASLPQLAFSFPFAIMERLMTGYPALKRAYEGARADFLEAEIADILATAMPTATVYRGVQWDDPDTGKTWENDTIAQLGNFLFVLEAKSGRISDVARRGGDASLRTNFKELFVEPGLQGWRLQNYINQHRENAKFRLKSDGRNVDFKLGKPKIIYRFSVCFEHFAGLTSAKYHLKELGLIASDTAWAPVLSLGELQMIARYLDSELAFQHYLTRRATLEDALEFDGDEQDILSMYLTNGLWFDTEALAGQRLQFFEADSFVRMPKTPRDKRNVFDSPGVQLSPLWKTVCEELYADNTFLHRFDVVECDPKSASSGTLRC